MLDTPLNFDALFAAQQGTIQQRARWVANYGIRVERLAERVARARALLALEMVEAPMSLAQIAEVFGVSRSRASQLASDGRLWRHHDQAHADRLHAEADHG